jgi:hypothetical protein
MVGPAYGVHIIYIGLKLLPYIDEDYKDSFLMVGFDLMIVKYQEELFIHPSRKNGKWLLFTRIKEKGERHGFKRNTYDRYEKWVNPEECQVTDGWNWPEKYRVKYKDHFFIIYEETEKEVCLMSPTEHLAIKYGFTQEDRDANYLKWVRRSEVIPIDKINERVGLYIYKSQRTHEYEKDEYWLQVFEILDENENEYLISSGADPSPNEGPWSSKGALYKNEPWEYDWIKKEDHFEKWVLKEAVFVYGESDEPLRY